MNPALIPLVYIFGFFATVAVLLVLLVKKQGKTQAGFFDKLTLKAPAVSIRLAALRAFSETQYYFDHIGKRSTEGRSMAEVDDEVEAVLRDGAGAPTSE